MGIKIIFALAVLFITNGSTFVITNKLVNSKWKSAVDEYKILEANKLASIAQRVLIAERSAEDLKVKLELANEEHKDKLNKISVVNRELTNLYGMRDPGSREDCASTGAGMPKTSGTTTSKTTGARLSNESAEFLLAESRRADEAAAYAQACYRWVKGVVNEQR